MPAAILNANAAAPPTAPGLAKAQTSAREFEAMTIGHMLQPMFSTVDNKGSLFSGGAGEESWKPMLVNEIAKKIAEAGGLGLAKPILAEMLRLQEARDGPLPGRKAAP